MGRLPTTSFHEHCAYLTDPRHPNARHPLSEIIVIAICAVICGAEGWEDLEAYGKAQVERFKQVVDLPHGIPCHATFRRVLSQLDPYAFTQGFIVWTAALSAHFVVLRPIALHL